MAIQGVIFDMDGLLFDTERLSQNILAELCTNWGYQVDKAVLQATIGHNYPASAEIIRNHYGADFPVSRLLAAHEQQMNAALQEKPPPLKEGVVEILTRLQQRNIHLAIATSSPTARARRAIELAGLSDKFSSLIGGDLVAHPKPHPEIYLQSLAALKLAAHQAIVFEDSPIGVRAAHAAGIATILIPDLVPYHPQELPKIAGMYSSLKVATRHLKEILAIEVHAS